MRCVLGPFVLGPVQSPVVVDWAEKKGPMHWCAQVGACLSAGLPQALLQRLDWRSKGQHEGEEVREA